MKSIGRWLRRAAAAGASALVVMTMLGTPAQASVVAAQPGATIKLGDPQDLKKFVGTVGRAAPTKNLPECAGRGCVSFTLKVDLPKKIWQKHPGAVEVAIEWIDANTSLQPYDALSLYVRKDGKVLKASEAQVGTAQSIFLDAAANGEYKIVVAFNPLPDEANSPQLNFKGIVEVEQYPQRGPPQLLPDLQALPTSTPFSFDEPIPFLGVDAPLPGSSCFYKSEVLEQDAKLCLRFGQAAVNTGRGALDLWYSKDVGTKPEYIPTYQHIQRIDGQPDDVVFVGMMHFHVAHDHYHLEAFSKSSMYRLNSAGKAYGAPVVEGKKNGFCAASTLFPGFGLKGNGPLLHDAPRCLAPRTVDPPSAGHPTGLEHFNHGIDSQWADEYIKDLPDQDLIVRKVSGAPTGVTDGDYEVRTEVNPDHHMVEADYTNNCIAYRVRLSGLDTDHPMATQLAAGLKCTDLALAA